jgi:hypothetical protein
MALTIQSAPPSKSPAWNSLNYVVSSTNTAQIGYKVVCKVYTSGPTLVQTLNLFTYPGTTRVYVNVSRIIQNYISLTNVGVDDTPEKYGPQGLLLVYCTFQEYYNGALQGSIITSSNTYCWKAAFPPYFEKNELWEEYMVIAGASSLNGSQRFLTGFDNTIEGQNNVAPASISINSKFKKLKEGQRQWLWYLLNSGSDIYDVKLGLYDETGTRTHSDYYRAILDSTFEYYFAIGTDQIESHSWHNGFTLDTDDKYMVIQINDSLGITKTYSYLFEFDWTPCNAFEHYEVQWLNPFGGFDSWVFNRVSHHDTIVNQSTYKSDPFDITSPTFNPHARYVKPFHTQLKDVYELNTQNLQEWEYNGLKTLITSPEVYIKVNDVWFSCYIQDVNQYRNHKAVNGVFNMNIKIVIDQSQQVQW